LRRLAVLVLLTVGLAACGGSPAPKASPVEFGITGGNIAPYTVTISPSGAVRARGSLQLSPKPVPASTVASLAQSVSGLTSEQCPGTLPDIASRFVRAGGRTVRVHGSCEPAFDRLYNRLAGAVGLQQG
jgi:hypothetical protein